MRHRKDFQHGATVWDVNSFFVPYTERHGVWLSARARPFEADAVLAAVKAAARRCAVAFGQP
jgi:hypothetical protein